MLLNTSVGTSQLVFRICTLHWQYLAFSFDGWCGVRKARACCRIGIKARMVAKARSAFALLARLPHCISKRTLCKRTISADAGAGSASGAGAEAGAGGGAGAEMGGSVTVCRSQQQHFLYHVTIATHATGTARNDALFHHSSRRFFYKLMFLATATICVE